MIGLLLTAARRFHLRHPWQLCLTVLGISLGVAVYVGVDLANSSAARAFELSARIVNGGATHRLLPLGGTLSDTAFRTLVVDRGITRAAPIIQTTVGIADAPGERYTLLGVAPIKEALVSGPTGLGAAAVRNLRVLMEQPGSVVIPASLAHAEGLQKGSHVALIIGARKVRVTVANIMHPSQAGSGENLPIITDIATAQTLTGMTDRLSRIDLRLDAVTARHLAARVPTGTVLVSAQRKTGFEEISRAFRTNLTALGLLALVVGMFLIYSTMSFVVVQRRPAVGTLFAIGLSRRQLLTSVLAESFAIGVTGTIAGLLLGTALAHELVGLVLNTIGDFAYRRAVQAVAPSPFVYVRGGALGLGATLLAGLGPALDATRTAPGTTLRRAALEARSHLRSRRALWLAPLSIIAGFALIVAAPRSLYGGFIGLFCVLGAGALATPATTAWLTRRTEPLAGRVLGLPGLLAVRGVGAGLSRTGVATAALAVAVAAVIGIGLMIASFRSNLTAWLETTLTANLYVDLGRTDVSNLADLEARIRAMPGVSGIRLALDTRLPSTSGTVALRAIAPGGAGWGLDITSDHPDHARESLLAGKGIAISQPFAFRHRLSVGDQLQLPTPTGLKDFPVVGVYRSYNTGGSEVAIGLQRYRATWGSARITSMAIRTRTGTDDAEVEHQVAQLLPSTTRIESRQNIMRLSLAIFDRTFRITEVLRGLAAVIAFLGILSALLAMQLEKAREFAILRAVGFTPGNLGRMVLTQTTVLGVAAGVCAIPIGVVLAGLLVHVINQRSFGWSMGLELSAAPILAGLGLAVAAAVLAGFYPAWRGARLNLATAIREE